MKRMFRFSFLLFFLFIGWNVYAQTVIPNAFVCDNNVYTMGSNGYKEINTSELLYYKGDDHGTGYRLAIYGAYNSSDMSFYSQAYCLSPLKHGVVLGSYNSSQFKCLKKINPESNNAYDLSMLYLHQKLIERGYPGPTGSDINFVDYIVQRWLAYDYMVADTTGTSDISNLSESQLNQMWLEPTNRIWSSRDRVYSEALSLYNDVKQTVSRYKTFDEMVAAKVVWVPEWSHQVLARNPGSIQVKITLNNTVNNVYWNEFVASCSDKYTCNITRVSEQTGNSAVYDISISGETATTSFSELALKIHTSWYDIKSVTANSMLVATVGDVNSFGDVAGNYTFQKYIMTFDSFQGHKDSTSILIGTGTCAKPHENGNDTDKWICNDTDGDGKGEDCATRNPSNPEAQWKQECSFDTGVCNKDSANKNDWLCADQNGDGVGEKCITRNPNNPEAQWQKECAKASCTKEGNKYYCDDLNSDGSADECSESEYTKKCECPKIEEECNNGNQSACDEFDDKCVNCVPTVTIPSDCYELEDYNVNIYNDTYVGKISDITRKATRCTSNKENTPKSCVIGKEDASKVSYEDKTISVTQGNRYCKVWCEESYDFGLPTAKYTTSGRYFTLQVDIKGTRTCYASAADNPKDPIDTELFETDIEQKRREIIDAYNEYSYWYYAATTANEEHHTDTHTSSDCPCCGWSDPDPVTNSRSCVERGCNGDSTTDDYYTYTWSWKRYNYYNENESWVPASDQSGTEGYCPSRCCDGNCIDGERGTSQFGNYRARASSALNALNQRVREFKKIIEDYDNCSGKMSGGGVTSSGWTNEMKFDPVVTFYYDEGYLDKGDTMGVFEPVGNESHSISNTYCEGDTDRNYKCLGNEAKNSNTNAPFVKNFNPFICDENGCNSNTTFVLGTSDWVMKEVKYSQTYTPKTTFSTYTQYGTIRKNASGDLETYTSLPDDAYPVSLIQETGVYPFYLNFDNIGQSNEDGSLGRLIGKDYRKKSGKNDILTSYNKLSSAEKCDINGNVNNKFETATTENGYICHYINNCDDCKFECEKGKCSFDDYDDNDDECTDCKFKCDTCIFDGNNVTYNYRTVSLNKLFPSNRAIGYNWRDTNIKAQVTRQEIQNLDTPESIYETPQYSFTLSPASLSRIRKYNDETGSYMNTTVPSQYANRLNGSDSAVYCDNVTYNGIDYSVRCKSRFLDLIEEYEHTNTPFATNVYRITSTKEEDDNAWELFTSHPKCKNGSCLTNGIGPSWRLRTD